MSFIYVPTPQEVVDEMLALAKVTKNDVIYDLGSRNRRIPVTVSEWKPERVVQTQEGSTIYLWTIPKEVPANLR